MKVSLFEQSIMRAKAREEKEYAEAMDTLENLDSTKYFAQWEDVPDWQPQEDPSYPVQPLEVPDFPEQPDPFQTPDQEIPDYSMSSTPKQKNKFRGKK